MIRRELSVAAGDDERLVGDGRGAAHVVAAADELHDLEPVALGQPDRPVGRARHDLEIALDRDLGRVERQVPEQRGDRHRARKIAVFAVKT